ncbi:MAG: hypothetical protein ACM3O9_09705, partial [Methylocystaceae bacterium]
PHNHQDWVLSSVNTGMLGAFLLLPLLVRSFMPAFSASGGVEFLAGRTKYLGLDIVITLVLQVIVLLLIATAGIWLAALGLNIPLSLAQLLPIMLFNALPSLLLLVAIMLILLTILPSLMATILFWLLLGGLGLSPNLAPWDGLMLLSGQAVIYSPLMLLNRLFCLIATGLLVYIYALLLKNQSQGLITTRQRRQQARLAEANAVIIAGRGLVLGNQPNWELMKMEMKNQGYYLLLTGWLGSAGCALLAYTNQAAGIAGLGLVILLTVPILSPLNIFDQLLSNSYRQKWQFIGRRILLPCLEVMIILMIFWILGPKKAAYQVFWGFFVVWGWAWLCSHYWSMTGVRVFTSLFWIAIVLFPGALTMTTSTHWWLVVGIVMILVAVGLYRRQMYRP